MRATLVVWLALAGCGGNDVADLDGDGIPDLEDPCQADEADGAGDLDSDGLPNATDPCPLDAAPHLGDADDDGIPETCDPFPVTTGPDTARCITTFADPTITDGYLIPREGETGWTLGPPLSITGAGSIVSSFPATTVRSTTYEVLVSAQFDRADDTASFRLWLRAGPAPSEDDLACGIDGAGNLVIYRGAERIAPRPLAGGTAGRPLRLRATVQSSGNNTILCRLSAGSDSVATTTAIPLPDGTFGFAAIGGSFQVQALAIYDRPDAPPF